MQTTYILNLDFCLNVAFWGVFWDGFSPLDLYFFMFRVKHIHVKTKGELDDALFTSQREDVDCVVEVESSIDTNVEFHR